MSSRIFQSIIIQMKDATDRCMGVVDDQGYVVACSELTCIGEQWSGAVSAVNAVDGGVAYFEGKGFLKARKKNHAICERS